MWPLYINKSLAGIKKASALESAPIFPEEEQQNDNVNVYSYNSKKYRSPEFIKNPDVLAIGCSQTWGVGVPDEYVWTKLLADKLNMSYINLGVPGASTLEIVRLAMSYIELYGKPKYLVALVPDIRRLYTFINSYVNSVEEGTNSWGSLLNERDGLGSVFFPTLSHISKKRQVEALTTKFSKRPHKMNEVLGYEVPASQGIMALEMLQRYCNAMSIELLISSWDDDTVDVYRGIKLENFYYLDYERDTIEDKAIYENSCHEDISGKHGDTWYRGSDYRDGDSAGHIGIHRHIDYAELFYREIEKREGLK